MVPMKLRSQAVGAAEQELGVLDAQAAQQHGQAVDAQTETTVGRAAVLEELQIELDIFSQTLFLSLLLQHFVAVLTLGTGGDLNTTPDQVVALRHAVLIPHVVERTLLGGIIGDEEELVTVVLLHPLIAQALGLSGQVALLALVHGVAELFFQTLVQVCQLDHRERSGGNDHFLPEHLLDLEFSYITSYKDVMKMEDELLTAGLQAVKDNYGDQIKEMFGQEVIVPTTPFPVVKLADLYKGLEEEFGYTVDESEKGDLTTEAERLSYEWVKKHYGHEFLFITDYSAEKRAFYHMRDENGVPQGYDLIWRGVEITTGAQREHRYEVLKKQAEEKGLAEDVKFYLEFFQYGCPPHGGFGLGIDRLTMLLCGLSIKDAEFLFRGPNRLTP